MVQPFTCAFLCARLHAHSTKYDGKREGDIFQGDTNSAQAMAGLPGISSKDAKYHFGFQVRPFFCWFFFILNLLMQRHSL